MWPPVLVGGLKGEAYAPMTEGMSLQTALARISELTSILAPQAVAPPPAATAAANSTAFAGALESAMGNGGAAAGTASLGAVSPGGGGRAGLLRAVQGEVGQAEQPPGSNDSPRISQYRASTAGAPGPGPWCAYFTSWAAREAGVPLGEQGQGFGSVDAVYDWAQRAGRAVPAGSGMPPRPGDLIVWDEHIGVVESVSPDGTIQTIEGNSSDQVARRTYGRDGGGAVGYVRLG